MIALLLSFWIAEWGVVDAEAGRVISSLPEQAYQIPNPIPKPVRAPVIYFYGDLPKEITLSLGVSPGNVLVSEPGFATIDGKPSWKVKPGNENDRYGTKRGFAGPCWTDSGATTILANGHACDYIFYEAKITYDELLVPIDFKPQGGILHNMSKHPVHDVLWLVYDSKGNILGAYLHHMNPGDTVSVRFANLPDQELIMARLMSLGFTEGAARAFYEEWWPVFTKKPVSPPVGSLPRMVSLSYRLSPDEVDELLPLTLNPEPEKLVRAWWVLIR